MVSFRSNVVAVSDRTVAFSGDALTVLWPNSRAYFLDSLRLGSGQGYTVYVGTDYANAKPCE